MFIHEIFDPRNKPGTRCCVRINRRMYPECDTSGSNTDPGCKSGHNAGHPPSNSTGSNHSNGRNGYPGPTQTLPPNYMLDFMVQGNGDTVNPYMVVTLRGGNGMNFDSRVDVTFTKPDGTSQQDFMLPPFYVGQYVSFPSSTYQNRVEIWVTAPTVGKVKTYDEIVPFRAINP